MKSRVRFFGGIPDASLNLVLVAYNDRYVVKSIEASVKRLGYPQSARPMAFCRIKDILENPLDFEIEIDGNKIKFAEYVQHIRKLVAKRPEYLTRKNSDSDSGKSKAAA